jgi:hypothetical protein
MRWQIVDTHTGRPVGKPYRNRDRARARRDKLDTEHGSYRYRVQRVEG